MTISSLLLMTALAAAPDAGAASHFQTPDGEPLPGFEAVWDALHDFYGDATPATFTLVVRPPGPSQFNSAQARLLLPADTLRERGVPILVHEGSHVCLSRLTGGASELESLRFVDEGLATLFEHQLAGSSPQLERAAREAAALQLAAGNLSFERLAQWKTYFGTPPQRVSAFAYPVGAAFDLYVRSTFGEERFKAFLRELGRRRELDAAARKAFGQSAAQLEKGWLATLAAVKLEPPAAVGFEPTQGATGVPVATRELRVTLNAEMAPSVCVQAECGESHVCFTGARWASPRELVIIPDGPLLPKHRYRIGLGVEGRCLMSSLNGQQLAPTVWEFVTE